MDFICRRCGQQRPESEKYPKWGATCRFCVSAYHAEYRRANAEILREKDRLRYEADPEKRKATNRRTQSYWQRMKKYGLTRDRFEALFAEQDGRCAICKAAFERNSAKNRNSCNVDHDHESGQIRGLLCNGCNRGIGSFRDDPYIVMTAVQYLNQHRLRRLQVVS